jgi:hypothetical protein
MNSKKIENLGKEVKKLSVADNSKKLDDSVEEYTQKEIEYLDRYHGYANGMLDDEELYEIIIKHEFDPHKIMRDIDEYMKLVTKKGEEYGWQQVVKGKSI